MAQLNKYNEKIKEIDSQIQKIEGKFIKELQKLVQLQKEKNSLLTIINKELNKKLESLRKINLVE